MRNMGVITELDQTDDTAENLVDAAMKYEVKFPNDALKDAP